MIGKTVQIMGQPKIAPILTVVGKRPCGDYSCIWYDGRGFSEVYAEKESLVEIS